MKTIKMLPSLIIPIVLGSKTQTRRIIKPQPYIQGLSHIWNNKIFGITKINNVYPVFIDILSASNYAVGDQVKVINSFTGQTSAIIEITKVKIEKLMDISNKDLDKEGLKRIDRIVKFEDKVITKGYLWFNYVYDKFDYQTPIESYKSLISLIYGYDTIHKNPYAYVYEFKRV